MVSLNKVLCAGNLTRDPELRFTSGGQPVGSFDIAINNYYVSKSGEKKEETVFINVTVWGKQAESARTYLTKGSPVLVEGRLQMDTWETKEGEKRSRLKINAQRLQFLGSGKSREANINNESEVSESGMPEEHNTNNSPAAASDEVVRVEEDDIPF